MKLSWSINIKIWFENLWNPEHLIKVDLKICSDKWNFLSVVFIGKECCLVEMQYMFCYKDQIVTLNMIVWSCYVDRLVCCCNFEHISSQGYTVPMMCEGCVWPR